MLVQASHYNIFKHLLILFFNIRSYLWTTNKKQNKQWLKNNESELKKKSAIVEDRVEK